MKDLKFSKIVDRQKRSIEMLLYGVIGQEINGHDFAQELNWLGREYDEITIRVNSDGGSVSQGLSIVSEMMASPAFIIAKVDGIAASMAAVVLAAADKVIMNDYAKVMVHSPYYEDEDGKKARNLSLKDIKSLKMLKATLSQLLSKRGIDKETINGMMRTDSWFDAENALASKLVDEIATTGRKKELACLEPLKLVAKLQNEHKSFNNNSNMKKVIAKLGLAEDATEDMVVEAIGKISDKSTPVDLNDKLVDKLIGVGKQTGIVTDKNEKAMRALAKVDTEAFCDMIDESELKSDETSKRAPQARMSDLVAKAKQNNGKTAVATERDFAWYEKNNPQALAKMEVEDPQKFAALVAEDEAKYE